MLATVVDTKELAETVAAAAIGGVGITFLFSLMIFGAARAADARRYERSGPATAYAALTLFALAATTAGIGFGLVVMLSK